MGASACSPRASPPSPLPSRVSRARTGSPSPSRTNQDGAAATAAAGCDEPSDGHQAHGDAGGQEADGHAGTSRISAEGAGGDTEAPGEGPAAPGEGLAASLERDSFDVAAGSGAAGAGAAHGEPAGFSDEEGRTSAFSDEEGRTSADCALLDGLEGEGEGEGEGGALRLTLRDCGLVPFGSNKATRASDHFGVRAVYSAARWF